MTCPERSATGFFSEPTTELRHHVSLLWPGPLSVLGWLCRLENWRRSDRAVSCSRPPDTALSLSISWFPSLLLVCALLLKEKANMPFADTSLQSKGGKEVPNLKVHLSQNICLYMLTGFPPNP